MKPRKTPIYMGMLLMAAIVVLCGWMGIEVDNGEPFSFLAVSRGGTETIRFWEKEPGACYVFLPSGMELDHLHISTQKPVRIGQRQMWRGRSCKGLEWETTYDLSGAEGLNTITFLRSENVGAMFLDTRSGSMEQIHASKGHQESGELRLYDEQGRRNYRGKLRRSKATAIPPFPTTTTKNHTM